MWLRNNTLSTFLIIFLISMVSSEARKVSSRGGSSSKFGSSRVSKPTSRPQYANPDIAKLSYSPSQQAAPSPAKMPAPSAPIESVPANRPVGWNVGETPTVAVNKAPVNSAPYPINNPPSMPNYPHNAPSPAYPNYPSQGVQTRFGENQPQFTPVGQPGLGFPQQPIPSQPIYPQQPVHQIPSAGYPIQPGQPAFNNQYGNQPPIINNYHQTQGSSSSGLQTALLAGVGGLSLYNALKPSDTKTIIINNTVIQPAENTTSGSVNVTPVSENSTSTLEPVVLAAYPSTTSSSAVVNTESIPLAPFPTAVCNGTECTVAPSVNISNVEMSSTTVTIINETTSSPSTNLPSSLAPLTVAVAMAQDTVIASRSTEEITKSTTVTTLISDQPMTTTHTPIIKAAFNSDLSAEHSKGPSGGSTYLKLELTLLILPLLCIIY